MTKFFNKKNLFLAHFWSIFQILGPKNIFSENLALSHTTSYGFLAPCQNLEKTERRTERRMDERTDRPNFIGPFQLTQGVKKSKNFTQLEM